jgi:hypothetical protein
MSAEEIERHNRVAADAVATALRFARSQMPEVSDARLLLLIVGNASARLGNLRVRSQDVMTVAWGFYEQGSELPAIDGDPPRFSIHD